MTMEERNIKLKHFITCMKCEVSGKVCDDNCPTQYEAGKMGEIIENLEAISKILEQQPCEDAISREDAMNMILGYGNEIKAEVMNDIKASMIKLPPVQPEPKTGHWINKKPRWIPSLSMTMHDAYECSNCGEPGVHWWKHCINCGARMFDPQESEK